MKKEPTEVIEYLTTALEKDLEAIKSLIRARVSCNEEIFNLVGTPVRDEGDGNYSISVLGLLNGVLHSVNIQPIAIQVPDEDELGEEVLGFQYYSDKPKDLQYVFDKWIESEIAFYDEVGSFKDGDPKDQPFFQDVYTISKKYNLEIKNETMKGWLEEDE